VANGNASWHDAVPAWAKTLVFLVGGLGFPIVTAGYFMARDVGYFASPATRNEAALARVESALTVAVKEMSKAVEARNIVDAQRYAEGKDRDEKQLHVSVETCRAAARAARDKEQELRCDYWRK
jgi:hypothetical protein